MKTIVVALKPGTPSTRILETARAVAAPGAVFVVVSYVLVGGEQSEGDRLEVARSEVEDAVDWFRAAGFSGEGVAQVATMSAGGSIVEHAEAATADLIVIGLVKRSRVGKALLGSDTQTVILSASCPVLSVRIA